MCSQCAAREPSSVTTVQSSSRTCVSRVPARRPSARPRRTGPARSRGPRSRRAVVQARPAAGASPCRCRGRRTPRRCPYRRRRSARPRRRRRRPRPPPPRRRAARPPASAAMPAHMRPLGRRRQRRRPRGRRPSRTTVIAASPCQPSTIAPQSIETTSPGSSTRGAGDAVHDLVVDRHAQRRRVAVVAEERRRRAGVGDDLGGDRVEVAPWSRPATARSADRGQRVGDHQAGPPHEQHLLGRLVLDPLATEHGQPRARRRRSPRPAAR